MIPYLTAAPAHPVALPKAVEMPPVEDDAHAAAERLGIGRTWREFEAAAAAQYEPQPMNFRARLALVLFLAPIVFAVLYFLLGKFGGNAAHWSLGEFLLGGMIVGGVLSGSVWTLMTTLKWIFLGRA